MRNTSFTLLLLVLAIACSSPARSESHSAAKKPRYIVVNMALGAGRVAETEVSDYCTLLGDVYRAVNAPDNAELQFGVSFIFSILERTPANLQANIAALLTASEKTGVPILITLDGQNWWESRPDLWNWWDPAQPGFNPDNTNNVEWTGWSPAQAVKIGWRNWGTQIRVAPAQNLASPEVVKATHTAMNPALATIAAWYRQLPAEKQHLFIGVKLGWEAGIGYNAYYYPDGNTYLDRSPNDASGDPHGGLALDKGLNGGLRQLGYGAVKAAGIKEGGTLTREDIGSVIRIYLAGLAKLAHDNALPSDRVFVHQGGTYAPYDKHLPYDAAFNDWSVPGWSFYFVGPAEAGPLGDAMKQAGRTQWAAAEWLWPRQTAAEWQEHLERTLNFLDCRFVCIYNWDQGGISASPEAVEGIRQTIRNWRTE